MIGREALRDLRARVPGCRGIALVDLRRGEAIATSCRDAESAQALDLSAAGALALLETGTSCSVDEAVVLSSEALHLVHRRGPSHALVTLCLPTRNLGGLLAQIRAVLETLPEGGSR